MTDLLQELMNRWKAQIHVTDRCIDIERGALSKACGWLFREAGLSFAGIVVEETAAEWSARYGFYREQRNSWIELRAHAPLGEGFPSISAAVCAADWHEREAEDLFGLNFEGHPRLGDFVLHNDSWQEGVAPMRHAFSAQTPVIERQPDSHWNPQRVVEAPGVFLMPIGPVFAGGNESVHFLIETVGEDVIRCIPRLFYKYRGIEKIAEGRHVEDVLLLAERFSATTAFAHALGFCHAVEAICGAEIPVRARTLRVFLAELERFRHHVGAIKDICESTALVVAASQTGLLEEELLRVSGTLTGHRYLFGLAIPGGLAADLGDAACQQALRCCQDILRRLDVHDGMLRISSSFLDRIEEVGFIDEDAARAYGLVGPVARASGIGRDLRRTLPYGGYEAFDFDVPVEREGDGYARLRVLFSEARQSVRIMEQALAKICGGPVRTPFGYRSGVAWGQVEAPRGAAFHWLRLEEDGIVARYHIMPPSFSNWHGFHLSVENFAFQDFPIIMATMGLSVAESDR